MSQRPCAWSCRTSLHLRIARRLPHLVTRLQMVKTKSDIAPSRRFRCDIKDFARGSDRFSKKIRQGCYLSELSLSGEKKNEWAHHAAAAPKRIAQNGSSVIASITAHPNAMPVTRMRIHNGLKKGWLRSKNFIRFCPARHHARSPLAT